MLAGFSRRILLCQASEHSADTQSYPSRMTSPYRQDHAMDAKTERPGENHQRQVRWTHRHGRVKCVPETVDYPDELNNGFHVMLDSEELDTVRRNKVETATV